MKKRIAGLISLIVAGTMATSVHAETTTMNYSQTSTYTLSIPSTVMLSATQVQSLEIGASAVNTIPTQKVQVKCTAGIDTNGNATLTRTGGGTTKVRISKTSGGTGINTSTVLAEFQDQSTTALSGGGTIYFSAVGNVNAGTYTGTVTFTGSLASR